MTIVCFLYNVIELCSLLIIGCPLLIELCSWFVLVVLVASRLQGKSKMQVDGSVRK